MRESTSECFSVCISSPKFVISTRNLQGSNSGSALRAHVHSRDARAHVFLGSLFTSQLHTQKSDGSDGGEKWKIFTINYGAQTCYKLQAINGKFQIFRGVMLLRNLMVQPQS